MKKTLHASIITGGGRGIGRAITLRLSQETAVVVVGRNKSYVDSICEEIENSGGNAASCPGDVTNPTTADYAVQIAKDRGWLIQNLICNAGISKSSPTTTFDHKLWSQIFDVNVNGCLYFIQKCVPEMLKHGGGTVCLMSSIAGLKGYKREAAYTASKHAIVGLARVLAKEYGKQGIVSIPVCPSFVESDMTRRTIRGLMNRRSISEQKAEEIIANTNPQGRIIPSEEVAELIAFLCSRRVPSLSGNPIILSGGE